jgi:hypothetical protein
MSGSADATGADAASGIGWSSSLVQGAKTGVGAAAGKAVEGDGDGTTRRYAGRAVAGAVHGGMQVGLHGAAIGAAKDVGIEAAKDAVDGASKITNAGLDAESSDKRLGAGGTGYERAGAKNLEGMSPKAVKSVAVGGAAAASPPAMAVVMLMALLTWLKSMFFALLAMAANMANLIWTFLVGIVKAVASAIVAPFMAIGSFLANAVGTVLGVAVTAIAVPVAAAASGVVATIAAVAVVTTVVTGVIDNTALTDDSSQENCAVNASNNDDPGPGAEPTANTEANAKTVYSVFTSWGMPDENIAGILGNWSRESGIDPTSVESIVSEPYQIGPRKKAAWAGNFTQIPGQSHGGIGLGQWSNGRTMMLLDYAKAKNVDWYTIETQLAFMLQSDNPGDAAVVKGMLTTPQASPSAAAYYFHSNWERSADNASRTALRAKNAEMWFGKMSGWKADDSVTGGVRDIVGNLVDSLGTGTSTAFGNCKKDDKSGEVGGVSPKDGGMTQEKAQKLVDLFNKEGDKFLDERYGESGGPGSCGSNHAENCVSFSTYFANKYTTFQTYPQGDGIRTAYTIAEQTGKTVSATPAPYSIGSGPGSGPAGHTLVVLGVQGDKLVVGEAGYCAFMGRVRVASATEMAAQGWKFVDMSDSMLPADKIKTS